MSDVSGGTGFPRIVRLKDDMATVVGTSDLEFFIPGNTGTYDARRPEIKEWPTPINPEQISTEALKTITIERGYWWDIDFYWPAMNKDARGEVARLLAHKAEGGLFKVYPHYGTGGVRTTDPDVWYICVMTNFDFPGYLQDPSGGDSYVGYGPCRLTFRCVGVIMKPYHDDTPSYWCDVAGSYDADEIFYWGDVADATYNAADCIAYWTPTGAVYDPETKTQIAQL